VEAALLSSLLSSASVVLVLDVPVGQLRRVSRATLVQNIAAEAASAAGMSVGSCVVAACESCPPASDGMVWSNRTANPATGQPYVPARATPTVRLRVRVRFLPLGSQSCQFQGAVWPPNDWLVDARSHGRDPVAFTGPQSNASWASTGSAAEAVRTAYFNTYELTAMASPSLQAASLAAAVADESSHRVIGSWLVWASGSANAGASVEAELRCLTDSMEGSDATWWAGGACESLTDVEEKVGWSAVAGGVVLLGCLAALESWMCMRCRAGRGGGKLGAIAASSAVRDRRAAVSLLGAAGRGVQTAAVAGLVLGLGRLSPIGMIVSASALCVHGLCAALSAMRAIGRSRPREWDEVFGDDETTGPGELPSPGLRRVLERRWLGGMGMMGKAGVAVGCLMDADTALGAACPLAVSSASLRRYLQLSRVPSLGMPLPGASLDVGRAPMTWRVWLGLDDSGRGGRRDEAEASASDRSEASRHDSDEAQAHDRVVQRLGQPGAGAGELDLEGSGAGIVLHVGMPSSGRCDDVTTLAGSDKTGASAGPSGKEGADSWPASPAVRAGHSQELSAGSSIPRNAAAASAVVPAGRDGVPALYAVAEAPSRPAGSRGRDAASRRRKRSGAPALLPWLTGWAIAVLPEAATLTACGLVVGVALSGPSSSDPVGAGLARRLVVGAGLFREPSAVAVAAAVSAWLRPQLWEATSPAVLVGLVGVAMRAVHAMVMSESCRGGQRSRGVAGGVQ